MSMHNDEEYIARCAARIVRVAGADGKAVELVDCRSAACITAFQARTIRTPHELYGRLLRETNVCRVDVSALLDLDAAKLAAGSRAVAARDERTKELPGRVVSLPRPFCTHCGRDLREGIGLFGASRRAPESPSGVSAAARVDTGEGA